MLNLNEDVQIKKENKIINLKKRISFNNKRLKNMPIISNLKHIEILSLNDNEISTLSFCQDLPNLKELYMINNNIKDLKQIDYLSQCKFLHTIYLKGNPIQLNNNQIYFQKIKNVVNSIRIIDGFKMIQNNKINLYMVLKYSKKNKYSKFFNKDIIYKNIKNKNYINKNRINTETSNEREPNKKYHIYKEYKSDENIYERNIKCPNIILKKNNSGRKMGNCLKFKNILPKKERAEITRKKSEIKTIKRIIDNSDDSSCSNNNVISDEDNRNEVKNNNIFNSVSMLLNGLNLLQLNQLQNYVNKKLSTKIIINNE